MIPQSFSPFLVAVSVAIACLASYTALDLAGRVTLARDRNRLTWLIYSSAAMGLGIWSMHFLGMLALQLPIALAYDVSLVLASALIAIAAAFLAMFTVSQAELPLRRLLIAGAIMGGAIAGMHYTGMAAMRMPASIRYSPLPVGLSIAIAVSASCIALALAFRYRHDESVVGHGHRALGAIVMGAAIAGMHYTGMSAAHFMPGALVHGSSSYAIPTGSWLTVAVIAGTLLVLILALVGAAVDRNRRLTLAEYARLRHMRDEMEATVERRTAELKAALVSAEKANLAKSQFLAHMSHELRTPLNSVIGFADILLRNKNGNQRPQDLIYIERIGANGRNLLSLINNVLDLAKVESGHVELEITQLSLAALIDDVISQLGVRDDRHVPLRSDVAPDLALISTDEAKLRQILVNLIGNADKFTESGSITVRVVTDDGCAVPRRIDVIDTGVGIPADRLEAVFRPFEQADTSTTRKYGGTGLGLPITLAMCELLEAQLTVKSVLGEGSVFSITLPREPLPLTVPTADYAVPGPTVGEVASLDTIDRQCSRDALVAVLERHSHSTPTRVLVIEDEPDAQEMLLHHLRNEEDVETMVADSGISAMQTLGGFVPDLILLDIRMPKMDGLEFLRHIRCDPLYEHIPVVVVTGEALTIAERAQLMAQSNGIVEKGANLEHAVRSALIAVAKRSTGAKAMIASAPES